ncbi:MAG TPA: asparagine synthase (glutamine-hydrolyzing) [Verrucomicrobiales bacterium]|jgi:asparagine synthase (glutamine-hydrolysing)|nr:asparagine synthase (glutamine-hydrolyzing) [Verrucomicrobiales bacterium]
MCGIAGVLHFDGAPASPAVISRMTDIIAHRGPDGEGQFVDGCLGLGHRRLSIIDLSPAGRQPMMTADGRYVITFNGEIYNFQELRIELEANGWEFHSRTDTEVLLKGYAHWGRDVLNRLNGMFAFALWDRRERTLVLARDRYGIKPLYYGQFGDAFLFASEVKAMREHPDFRRGLDREALLEYFTFQNLFTDRTLFENVRLLPAGCFLTIKADGSSAPSLHRYWDYRFVESEPETADDEALIEELDRLFRQAVTRQLVSDVEVGSYLSGGMDSGSITAIAAGQIPCLRTFTCGFDMSSASGIELSYDERPQAEHMSYAFKTEHYEMVLKAGDMERVMQRLAWHIETPRVGQSYPNFYAAHLAGKFVKVCLSGSGGDELFGGYPWRYYRAAVNSSFEDYIDKYYGYWQRLIPNEQIQQVFAPVWNGVKHVSTRDIFRDVFTTRASQFTRPEDYINHSLYLEAKTFLHGLLVVEDKLSMAHSLETRVPFLDNDLVDFAMRLPVRLKLRNLGEVTRLNENERGDKTTKYFQRTNDGKLALRQVMARHIPKSITEGEKQGFSAPDASWFRGESIDYVRREILDPRAEIYSYLDRGMVESLVSEHLEGRENRRLLIWSLLSVECWLRRFLKD